MRSRRGMMFYQALLVAAVSMLFTPCVNAQPIYYIGGHASYTSNIYKANFNIVTNSAECGSFTNGTGNGLNYGLLFELPVMDQFRISARALFEGLGGTMNNQLDNGFQVYDSSTRSTVPLVRQHSYKATPDYASVDLLVRYAPFDFPLGFLLGPSIGLPIFS
ncbi:MAG TPA: hypothetical protein VFJ29_06215, partial [Candidatus Kapabacteria bacterium]|nr:hypothetical protein [Candidatus Kapabacteria bacterium]